jgi:hypothetical protein
VGSIVGPVLGAIVDGGSVGSVESTNEGLIDGFLEGA